MNRYRFEDIKVGSKESFTVKITEEMMNSFRNITGDINPLHTDDDFAEKKGFDGKVAYGMLTASFLSTLAGVYLPGENSLIRQVEVKFKKPVFPGDELTVTGEVSDVNEEFKIFDMKVTVVNAAGDKVLRGTMQMGVLDA